MIEVIKNILKTKGITSKVDSLKSFTQNNKISACIIPEDFDRVSNGILSKKENFKLEIYIFHSIQSGNVEDFSKSIKGLVNDLEDSEDLKRKLIKSNFSVKYDLNQEKHWMVLLTITGETRR